MDIQRPHRRRVLSLLGGAAAVGVFVRGEPFGSSHATAFVLAIAGVVLATRRDMQPPP